MKYLIRSVKYFFYFSFLCAVIVSALVLIGAVEGDINAIFAEGYGSIGKIAIFFAMVSAVYPKVSFITREVAVNQDWKDIREDAVDFMKERGYELESENEGTVSFRLRSAAGKLKRMYEDRITMTRYGNVYTLDGHRKDVMRLAMGLEHRFNLN